MTPLPLHRDGRYVRIWLVGWLTGVVRWLELLAFGIFAFEVTGSPLLVAVVALARFLPLAVFSLVFGAAADQASPRKLLTGTVAGVTVVSGVMLLIQQSGSLAYWHIIVATLASGIFWASDMPLRRKMIGEIAGPDRLAKAMSWDYATSNGTRMIGPLIGGILYDDVGMGGIFAIGLALYLASLICALGIAPTGGKRGGAFAPGLALIGSIRATKRALRNNDAACVLAVTVIFNIWGFPFVSMIPVIGDEVLGLTPTQIGRIASIDGATGFIGIVLVGFFATERWFRRIYLGGCILYIAMVGVAGLFPGVVPLSSALAVAGVASAGFATMQATIVYMIAPKGMRGRYLGLISICIGAGLIGFANVGLMAELFGPQAAATIIAAEGMIAILVLLARWRALQVELGLRPPAVQTNAGA
ncbi:MAG: MFS transporter [Pseudomonadota bacterium]